MITFKKYANHLSPESFIQDLKKFNDKLNEEPAKENTEKSEDGDFLHVPIAYLEKDLKEVFEGAVQIIIKEQKEMFGAITMFIGIKVFHPVYQEWLNYDGTAAVVIESELPGEFKGSSKTLIREDIKTSIALCYSEAIKNAAKKIGRRFGSDLNRINKPGKSVYESNEEAYIFDATKKYTKKDLLQLIAAGKITTEMMDEYLKGKK